MTVGICAFALLAVVVCAALVTAGYGMVAAFARVDHTRAVLAQSDALLIALLGAQTGQRGYLLTGEERYLEPYIAARTQVSVHLDELARLTADNARQTPRIQALRAAAAAKLVELNDTIDAGRSSGRAAGIAMVQTGRGKQLMDGIRSDIAALAGEEYTLLAQRNRLVVRQFSWAGFFAVVIIASVGILVAVYVRSLFAHQRQQAALSAELENANIALEKRVEERTRELQDANNVKSRFLANMSHELRTPLNAIIGFSQLIAQETIGPIAEKRYTEYAAQVETSGQHLLDLINDILDLSKIEAGRFSVHPEWIDPRDIAEACVRMIQPLAQRHGVVVSLDVRASPGAVHADPKRMRQILLNLLSNAVKFTPSGRNVTVSLANRPDGRVALVVADQGIGMSDDDIAVALTPFGQVDNVQTRRHEGTGLGLPLTRMLVEQQGGSIEIASQPDRGTTVTVLL